MNSETQMEHRRLIDVTNARVAANAQPGSNAHSGWLSAIRAGITPPGELTAIPQAGRYIASLTGARQRSAALRAAAIRAINKDVHQHDGQSLGRALAILNDQKPSSSIEGQVAVLPLMTLDGAALVLDGLVARLARPNVGVDFRDLSDSLIFWGTGAGDNQRRSKIVLDFYSSL